MASQQTLLRIAVAVLLLALHGVVPRAVAIQVTPNSPCASLCIDDSSLDTSDPNSSNTVNSDLSCQDSSFSSSAAGKKWSSCMNCLQNSTFVQGAESDQAWFFYNLRYNFDFCIFGYPNASGVASSPCQTSTACGPLLDSLSKGIPNMGSESEYAYCDSVVESNSTTTSFDACLSCIRASNDDNILTNSLIALQAGCQQQLPGNESVGLSGPVCVATSIVSIVSPTPSNSAGAAPTGTAHRVATTTIVIIVVVSLLVVAAIAGFVFVCLHKRKRAQGGRRTKAPRDRDGGEAAEKTAGSGGGGGIGPVPWGSSVENITSPLSFQCRADRTSSASATSSLDGSHSTVAAPPQEQQLPWQQQAAATAVTATAGRKKYSKPQQLMQQTAEAGGGGSHLPAIAESPFPSPAAATTGDSPTRPGPPTRPTATALPRLYQLKTSFGSPASSTRSSSGFANGYGNGSGYDSQGSGTPTSATALLSYPVSTHTPASSAARSRHDSPASASTTMTPQMPPLHTPSSGGGLAPYIPSAYIPGSSVLQPQPPQPRPHRSGGAYSQSSGSHLPAWSSSTAAAAVAVQKYRHHPPPPSAPPPQSSTSPANGIGSTTIAVHHQQSAGSVGGGDDASAMSATSLAVPWGPAGPGFPLSMASAAAAAPLLLGHPIGTLPSQDAATGLGIVGGDLQPMGEAAAAVPPPHRKHRRGASSELSSPADSRAIKTAFPLPPQQRGRR